jgi:hypothetical protein
MCRPSQLADDQLACDIPAYCTCHLYRLYPVLTMHVLFVLSTQSLGFQVHVRLPPVLLQTTR